MTRLMKQGPLIEVVFKQSKMLLKSSISSYGFVGAGGNTITELGPGATLRIHNPICICSAPTSISISARIARV